ncbi:class I mannose-6-phosphate isomerase [Paenibacillus sp. 1011MAR3C5]|uniref:type I phosphomannose isomerase catalytic subunit n=1 Tax=Paenibacillus sp. 1011MAR3C5 TaxID=1675787 RepID=UPI000E6C22F0|nr:type I phosphomannose isomerase catalytic subunit [Paenibacillus sp. 1011MAR3C5]RJE91237.1 class I mannose-6-phosphate isomerase [Paenibacillus sp. 1011MAR3C5]
MSMKAYPLQFKAEMKERIWGGRALESFGIELPLGSIGEAWMISDHPNGVTRVENGPLKGLGLDQIREKYGSEWFGTHGSSASNGRFPLLIKLLDCNDDLSIQVHPTDAYNGLPVGESGKTEMWYILDAKPGAKIIYGLKESIDAQTMAAAIEAGRIMDTLHEVPVKAGDAFYIPAGTVHALCSGVVVAEIQQNSDTTYRLYDYDRPGLDGKLRELHIEDSLRVIAYHGAGASRMDTSGIRPGHWLTIAESPYFHVEKGLIEDSEAAGTSEESFVILMIAEGEGLLRWEDGELSVRAGECFLLPATLGRYELSGSLTVLRSSVPAS